jgi:hypothetical protein
VDAAGDLTRLVTLLAQRKLVAPIELETDWQNVAHAINALSRRSRSSPCGAR